MHHSSQIVQEPVNQNPIIDISKLELGKNKAATTKQSQSNTLFTKIRLAKTNADGGKLGKSNKIKTSLNNSMTSSLKGDLF